MRLPQISALPASAVDFHSCLLGLASLCIVLEILSRTSGLAPHAAAAAALAALIVPLALYEALVRRSHRADSAGLLWDRPPAWSARRTAVKCVGLVAALAPIAAAQWLFPEYLKPLYRPWFTALRAAWPWLAVLAPVYIAFVDARQREPRDALWHLGRAVFGHPGDLRRPEVGVLLLGWAVKGFFLPLMFSQLAATLAGLHPTGGLFAALLRQPEVMVVRAAFAFDLVFATAGYMMTLRALDAQIRSVEPTVAGWLVALVCYQPFWGALRGLYFDYGDTQMWTVVIPPDAGLLRWMWTGAIAGLAGLYLASNAAFGLRFSNLTYRGTIASGPYRWSKHPSYLAKNLMWWLGAVTLYPLNGWDAALRNTLLLTLVSGVYFLRARTEERHLSIHPEYVAYAEAMNERALLAPIGRLLPFLRYRAARV